MTSPTDVTIHATTVVCIRHRGRVAVAGDGQVTFGQTIMKAGARKVRKMHHDRVLAGFAGAAADAFTLFARFEAKLEEHRGNLARAAVELAKEWRMDRVLRRLEALLAVADAESSFIVSGTGDVIEQINQQPLTSVAEYKKMAASLDPNGTTVLSVCRHRTRSFVVLRGR